MGSVLAGIAGLVGMSTNKPKTVVVNREEGVIDEEAANKKIKARASVLNTGGVTGEEVKKGGVYSGGQSFSA